MQMKVIKRNNNYTAVNLENLNLFRIDETEARILSLHEKGLSPSDIAQETGIPQDICEKTLEIFSTLPPGVQLVQESAGILDELLLMVAVDCNMACRYCYGDGGTYQRERTLMDTETAFKAVDTALSLGDIKVITLFGGEPLLNFEVIREVVLKYPDIVCGIISNGTIMTREIAQFLKEHKIPFTVSLDGPPEVHDAVRYYRDGKGTHARIMKTIKMLKEVDLPFAIEATFTKQALLHGYSARDVLDYLYEFTPTINFAAVAVVDDPDVRLTPEELIDFRTEVIDFTFDKIEKGEIINIFDITALITRIASPQRTMPQVFCPYHARRIAVFPNGDAYPCYLLSQDKYKYGNVFDPDFVEKFPRKTQEIIPHLCRDQLTYSPWFTPLLTHICVSTLVCEGDKFSLNKDVITAGPEVMEHLLYRMSRIRNWKPFFETLSHT